MSRELKQLYFSHDIYADRDEKIIRMFYHFRKNINEFSEDFLKRNFFHAAFGLFWEIVQYLHRNELTVDEIPMLADELRADESFVRSIINDFNLFKIVDNKIYSDRIQKNLDMVSEKTNKSKDSAKTRWLLSAFGKYYEEFFGEKPALLPDEIEKLKKYNESIPDLKDKLRDVLYTLKNLKFQNLPDFKPSANWLLTDNNFGKLYNGQFGKLKHKKTEKELKEEEQAQQAQKIENEKPEELELKIENCSGKAEALNIIADYYSGKNLTYIKGKLCIIPIFNRLIQKFDIRTYEIEKKCRDG